MKPERIIVIGADTPGLNGVLEYLRSGRAEAIVLFPDPNPLPEPPCSTMERYLGRGLEFPEQIRAFGIDTKGKRALVRDVISGEESHLEYDKLVLAAGAAPAGLDVPGEHLGNIVRVGNHEDAERLIPQDGMSVVVGGGHNPLLALSALLRHGQGSIEFIPVPTHEGPEPFSASLSAMVMHHLAEAGVILREDDTLRAIKPGDEVLRVVTEKKVIMAHRVINATANTPITCLAQAAGMAVDETGAIVVDTCLRTSARDVFACGGCAAFKGPACRNPIPGTAIRATERRQARTLAASLAGEEAEFSAPACAYSVDLGSLTVAGAGLTLEGAKRCGFTAMSATVIQFDRAHFIPEAELMTLELVFDAPTRRVLGIQGLGKSGDALCGRISAVSAILAKRPTIEDIANLEVAYSPPFASAMDVLNTVANVADNMLAGISEGMSPEEFERRWAGRESGNDFFLDCREWGNAGEYLERHPLHWNHIPQGEIARRLSELPKDRRIILVCNTGTRAYEAQVTLKHAGFEDVVNVEGGMAALRQSGVKV